MTQNIILQSIVKATKQKPPFFTQKRHAFYNKYRHGPSELLNPKPPYKKWIKEIFTTTQGIVMIRDEIKRVFTVKLFESRFPKQYKVNKTYIWEHFDSDESIKNWRPVCDGDSLNGFSTSTLVRSKDGHALFKGVIDTKVPEDGVTQKSGFAGVIGPRKVGEGIFDMEDHSWDWTPFNCAEIRFRGDGRRYMFVVNTADYTNDLAYYDNHIFPLHTRGGPYWETRRIYFSQMIFGYKNVIQDIQAGLNAFRVKFVALTLEDSYDGPFELEIDYIGLRNDVRPFDEICAYETYTFPHIKLKPLHVECPPPEIT